MYTYEILLYKWKGFQHKLVSCRWLFDSETMLPGGFFILKSGNFSLGTNYEFTNLSAEPIIDIKTTYRKQGKFLLFKIKYFSNALQKRMKMRF